jgi:hypothetical protein
MAPGNVTQLLSNEADIQVAISSIEPGQIQKNQHAATIFYVQANEVPGAPMRFHEVPWDSVGFREDQ